MKTSTHKTISNCQAGRRPRALFAPHDAVGRPRYGHLLVSLVCLLALAPALAVAEQVDLADPAVRAAYVEQLAQKSQAEKEQAWSIAQSQGWSAKEEVGDVLFELMAIRDGRVYVNMTNNENAAISTAADMVRNTAPYNVDGTGETVGIWDGGAVLSTHQEFGSRVTVMDGAASSYHSTHVGGTVGASGVSPAAMGMAPNVDIDSYNWTNDEAEMASRGMSFAGEAGTIQVSNHSYGTTSGWSWSYSPPRWYGTWGLGYREDELFGMYRDATRSWDEICYNAPYYLPFKSAGNDRNDDAPGTGATFSYYDGGWQTKNYDPATDPCDDYWDSGYDTISDKGIAKNVMTVGAVDDAVLSGSRHLPNATMADFSGWGPADDGRIKPDIVGNGVDVNSCDHAHDADYHIRGGTSMSTPNASGSAILLVEYYGTLFPAQYMRASTLKGLIIHTADDLGNPGPDYSFGWGLMNTEAAAALIEEQYDNPGDDIITEGLLNGANPDDSYTIDSDGVTPIRVTLCWTDPPGTAASSPDDTAIKLVNDLDLRITGPGGSPTYYPYVLNPASRSSNATTGDNIRDNVEQVYIDSPAAGTYTIEVSHKSSLTNAQQYYSLIAGGGGAAVPGGVLVYFGQCGGGADNVTPALANLGITDVTVVYNATDFENQLASGLWDLAVVDSYAGSMPSSAMDELVNYYDSGGKVILFAYNLYTAFAGHPIVTRAGVTLTGDYSSQEPIYAWIESPLFTTPNPVPDMTLYNEQCGRDGQYVQPVSASAHAGYTTNPTVNQAAITVNAQSRLILNAFAPQNFDQDQDTDGKIDMVELYENEINFLTGCLPPVPTNPSPYDGEPSVPVDTELSWSVAAMSTVFSDGEASAPAQADIQNDGPGAELSDSDWDGISDIALSGETVISTQSPSISGLSILLLHPGVISGVDTRLTGLGYNVTTTTNPGDLTRSNLQNYDVLFVRMGVDPATYAGQTSEIRQWVSLDGGGLVVTQPNVTGAQVTAFPAGFEVTITSHAYGAPPYAATIVDPTHPIVQGLTDADLPGDFDTVDQTDIGPSWDIVAVDAVTPTEIALLGGEYAVGRLAFCTGNFAPTAHDPGSDQFLIQLLDWLGSGGGTAWYFGPSITYGRSGLDVVEYGPKVYAVGGWGGGTKLEVLEAGSWSDLNSLPQPQEGLCAAVTSDGKIYTFGSYGWSDITQIYDIATDSWQAGPSLPQGLYWATAECVGQYIYVIGGYVQGGGLDTLHILDTVSGTWQAGPTMPGSIQVPASAVYDNQIYVFGNGRYYKYDIAGSSWSAFTGPPSGHGSASEAVTVGDEIYLIGGNAGYVYEAYTDTEIYDCTAGTWSAGPDLNVGRYQFAAAYSGGKLYAAGGRDENAATLDSVEILDIGCAITYDVYLGTSPGSLSLVCADSPVPTCDPGSLACCRTYYWKVVAKNCCGLTEGPIWSFVTVGAGTCWDPLECAGQPNGDGTCDGYVNFADLFALKAHFGTCAPWTDPECCSDYNHSGCINFGDLFILKAGFGVSGYIPSTANQTCP